MISKSRVNRGGNEIVTKNYFKEFEKIVLFNKIFGTFKLSKKIRIFVICFKLKVGKFKIEFHLKFFVCSKLKSGKFKTKLNLIIFHLF